MNYDPVNSRSVVTRLAILKTTLSRMTIAFWVLFLGGLTTFAVAFFNRDYWWLGGIIGILLGYGFGIYLASVLNLVVEWMVQMLIGQAEILDRWKNVP
jgi:hypothetical protein